MQNSNSLVQLSGSDLFVCDSSKGLLRLKITDPKNIGLSVVASDEVCDDVESINDISFVRSTKSLSQYRLKTENDWERLSRIVTR